jgi:hypothetical protein
VKGSGNRAWFGAVTGRCHASAGAPLLLLVASLLLTLAAPACDDQSLDQSRDQTLDTSSDIALSPPVFWADFGAPVGALPMTACEVERSEACGAGQALDTTNAFFGIDASVDVGCDGATARCFAQTYARVGYELDVRNDDGFMARASHDGSASVRMLDLSYVVPANTLTFDVPRVDVYVGPAGTRREIDAGVERVGTLTDIRAGAAFTAERHLDVAEGSPARALIERSLAACEPFVFVLVMAPRLEAGAEVPAGLLAIDLLPKVRLGPRR